MDITESGFQTPASKKRKASASPSLPPASQPTDASKSKFLVFKGVSINITINEFKELLDFNKITHAEAERMKSKRTGRDLPFIHR